MTRDEIIAGLEEMEALDLFYGRIDLYREAVRMLSLYAPMEEDAESERTEARP